MRREAHKEYRSFSRTTLHPHSASVWKLKQLKTCCTVTFCQSGLCSKQTTATDVPILSHTPQERLCLDPLNWTNPRSPPTLRQRFACRPPSSFALVLCSLTSSLQMLVGRTPFFTHVIAINSASQDGTCRHDCCQLLPWLPVNVALLCLPLTRHWERGGEMSHKVQGGVKKCSVNCCWGSFNWAWNAF